MPTLYRAAATPGTVVRFKSTGVEVKIIGVMGELCQVRLKDGTWTMTPMRDLEYGYDTANVDDVKGPAISPLATTTVRSTELPIGGQTGQKVSGAAFVKRVFLEKFRRDHPAVSGIADNYGIIHMPDAFRPGTVLIEKATGRAVTVFAGSQERGMFVCKLANGAFELFRAEQLLDGRGQPLPSTFTKAGENESLTDMCKRLSGGGLRKMASTYDSLKRGQRVRLLKTGREGIAELVGDRVWVKFADGSADGFDYSDLEII